MSTPISKQESLAPSDSEGEDLELGYRGHKGKSALRPKSSKYVPKETVDDDMAIKEDGDADAPDIAPNPSSPLKRKPIDEVEAPAPKRQHSRRDLSPPAQTVAGAEDLDEGIDMLLDQGQESEEADISIEADGEDVALPFQLTKEDFRAKGEGDTWTCPLDECLHRVYAASDAASQTLIKEHYRVHVNDEDASVRLQLVKRMEAPGLPVSRLMGRIQMISGQKSFPPPIMQRY